MEEYEECKKFLKENTKQYDTSHDYNHSHKVYENAMYIGKELKMDLDFDIIAYASLLHDVCDHKYQDKASVTLEQLHQFVESHLGKLKAERVMLIIDNISYSKQKKGLRKDLKKDNIYLDIIADADRVEALGKGGIERCRAYQVTLGYENVEEEVYKHCYDKLLRLYPESFIKTIPGRKLAEPLHQEIVDYVKSYENKLNK